MVRETFGAALRRHRHAAQLSLRALAHGIPYTYTYLWELETARKQGTIEVARYLDNALSAGGELVSLMESGATVDPAAGLAVVPQWTDAVDTVTDLWRGDMERRRLLVDAAYVAGATSAAALAWLSDRRASPAGAGRRVVGAADVESIREMIRAFRRVDNRWGGGQARGAAVRFLHHDVAPLLRDGRYNAVTGRGLLAATAELTHLAGWMAHDVGEHGLGQRYLIQALQLAMSADDRPLGAEVLAGMSQQAVYLGHGQEGANLAQAAATTARRAGVAALVAEAAVMEAHAEATLGDEAATAQALGRAEVALDRADRSADPQWIGYFDEAYLSAKFGHAFKALGRHDETERFARRSLVMDESYVRGRQFNLALLGCALAGRGEIEEAAAVATEAQTLAQSLKSHRADTYVTELRERLQPYGDAPAVWSALESAEHPGYGGSADDLA